MIPENLFSVSCTVEGLGDPCFVLDLTLLRTAPVTDLFAVLSGSDFQFPINLI